MKFVRMVFIFCMFACLVACSGSEKVTCDDPSPYKLAAEGKRVDVPGDLSNLEPRNEMPLPEASPRQPRPLGSPCLDRPPGS
jgi:hypothetical protein